MRKKILKGQYGINTNGLNVNYSGLLTSPAIGGPTQSLSWADQQWQNRQNQQTQDFHNSLQGIISPEQQDIDYSKYGVIDSAQQFADKTAPLLNSSQLKAGIALQQSSDAGAQVLGRLQADEAISKMKAPLETGVSTLKEKRSLGDKFSQGFLGQNAAAINQGLDTLGNLTNALPGAGNTYNGPKGNVRAGIDQGYNAIADTVANFGPYGQMASMAMKAANMLNGVQGAIFGATDGMTTRDAILDSPLGFLTGVGWINQAFGQKSDTITKNNEAFAQVGSAYGGANAQVDEALNFSGKKYGAFSSGARKDANALIAESRRQQNLVEDISNTSSTRFDLASGMSAINGNARAFSMQGGYDQSSVRVGKYGMTLQTIQTAKRIVSSYKFKQGGKTKDPFEVYLQSLPKNQQDSTNYRVKRYWELNGKPKNFKEALQKGMFTLEEDGYYHAPSVMYNGETGEYEFMKSPDHDTIHFEEDWYNSNDPEAVKFRNEYELQKTTPYWKYVKRKSKVFKDGGVLSEISLDNISEEYLEDVLYEVSLDDIPIKYFQDGGQINVIPEGALHARLHHMENAENFTKKGIPVVAEKEDGNLEQQAEIERDEIIFRLEVTKKLEELYKKYYSNESTQKEKDQLALEAGKLLTQEILYNTQDNTGLLNTIN